jgi:hypothetical protein
MSRCSSFLLVGALALALFALAEANHSARPDRLFVSPLGRNTLAVVLVLATAGPGD